VSIEIHSLVGGRILCYLAIFAQFICMKKKIKQERDRMKAFKKKPRHRQAPTHPN